MGSNCVYASMCLTAKKYGKKYRLDKFLRQFGFFESTEHRRFFLYSLLDTCVYPRPCPKCSTVTNDILSHALTTCAKTVKLLIRLKLLLFNANRMVSPTKFGCKITLYTLAMGNRLYRRALCEFLVAFGYWCYLKPLINRFQVKKNDWFVLKIICAELNLIFLCRLIFKGISVIILKWASFL